MNKKEFAVVVAAENKSFMDWKFPNTWTYDDCLSWMISNLRTPPVKSSAEKHDDSMNYYEFGVEPQKETVFLMKNGKPSPEPIPKPVIPQITVKRAVKVIW